MQGERTFLDKYIRASTIVWLMLLFTFNMIADGNLMTYNVKEAYVVGLVSLMTVILPTYIGAKTVEKFRKDKDVNNIS